MDDKRKAEIKFKKVVSEQFPINSKRGGGIIKIDAWENENEEMIKYSLAYINRLIYSYGDNGRVIEYDNTHNFHHKHYFGEISVVDDFVNYEELVECFEHEISDEINSITFFMLPASKSVSGRCGRPGQFGVLPRNGSKY